MDFGSLRAIVTELQQQFSNNICVSVMHQYFFQILAFLEYNFSKLVLYSIYTWSKIPNDIIVVVGISLQHIV